MNQRRTHKRFKVPEAMVEMAGVAPEVEFLQVLDISRGGLSFSYIAQHRLSRERLTEKITLSWRGANIVHLPFKIVTDREITGEAIKPMKRYRCSGYFGELTLPQMFLIDDFIRDRI